MGKKAFSGNEKKSGSLGESPPKRIKHMPQKQTKESASLKMVKVDTSEETFPRGGQQTLTPLEKSVIRTQAKQDALFTEEPIETTKTTGKLPRGLKAKKSEPKPMKRIDILSKKTVVPGMLLLGAVLEVNKLHAVFSLPFNLRGVVAISDVSDHVTKLVRAEAQGSDDMPADSDIPTMERLFSVGQLLPCYVQAIKGSLVNLSVNPYLVNSHLTAKDLKPNLLLLGFVKSVEDHGYIVDFGISGKSGFLLKKNAAEFVKVCRRGRSLCAGQVLQCVVLSATDTKAIPVSVNPSQVTTAILSQDLLVGVGSLLPGLLVKATVKQVAPNGLLVGFLDGFEGVVSCQHLSAPSCQSTDKYQVGKKVRARLLWVNISTKTVGLTFQERLLGGTAYDFHGVEIGDKFEGMGGANCSKTLHLLVTYDESMAPQSRVAESAATATGGEFGVVAAAADAETRGPKAGGDVMPVQDSKPIGSSQKSSSSNVHVGDIIPTLVVSVTPCLLKVKYSLWKGRVHCTLARDEEERVTVTSDLPSKELTELRRNVFSHLHRGDEVTCRVVKIRQTQIMNQASKKGATISTLELTTKPSLLDPEVAVDPGALLKKKWKNGDSLSAVVSKVSPSGLHVHLSPQISGFVPLLSVSKDIKVLKNLKKYYAEGQLVQCVVVDSTKRLLELSMIGSVILKDGHATVGHVVKEVPGSHLVVGVPGGRGHLDITDTSDDYQPNPFQTAEINGFEDVVEGTVVRGYIKAITDVGVFVRLGRGIDGRVQITHLRDGFKKDFKKLYAVGQLVRTKVLKVHQGTGKVDLSLRLSLVDPEAAKRKSDKRKRKRETEKEELGSDGENKQEIEEHGSSSDNAEPSSDADMETSEDEDIPGMKESDEEGVLHCTTKPTLSLAGGFRWETEGGGGGNERSFGGDEKRDTSGSSSEEEEEEEMEVETSTKKTRRQKKAAKKSEEIQLYRKERLLLDTEKEPESAEDFDRLLVSSPNQSSLWVQYMAFYLNTAEVDKARGIAQRALRTITFTEESEKLNVWVGWLNMENLYGTAETLAGVFESALEKCEPLHVYKKLATIYETSGKIDQASKLYHTMTKKFGSNQWVWSRYMTFLMQQMKYDQARSVLQRALKMLKGKQDHITTISKMSTLEYKYGDTERGCTMFESLVSTYPRKVDVWSVYIDAVIKTKDYQRVRELFERATNLKLSAQKMKSIYKKYLSFESEHGSQAMVEVVLEKARAFVNSYQAGMEVE